MHCSLSLLVTVAMATMAWAAPREDRLLSPDEAVLKYDPLPKTFAILGASMTARYGGPLIVVNNNPSAGELIAQRLREMQGLDPTKDLLFRAAPNVGSQFHYDEIARTFPLEGPPHRRYDMAFILDLFYKDFRSLEELDESRVTDARQRAELVKMKRRVVEVLERLARNVEVVWLGSPLTSFLAKDGKTGREREMYAGPALAHAWFKELLKEERFKNVRLYDLRAPYNSLKSEGQWLYECNGESVTVPAKKVFSPDGWHPGAYGTRLIANQIIERINLEHVNWKIPFFEVRH